MQFFNSQNISTCSQGIFNKYNNSLSKSQFVKDLKQVYDKTNFWAERVKSQIPELEILKDSVWQVSGNYKKYTWARLCIKGDRNFGIYYTIGIDFRHNHLFYKIDCQRKGKTKLLSNQIKKFDSFMRESSQTANLNLQWQTVQCSNLGHKYSNGWKGLTNEIVLFISNSLNIYKEVIPFVWGLQSPVSKKNKFSLDALLKKQERQRVQGEDAERFVVEFERKRLHGHPKLDRIEMISNYFANAGYDINSFHKADSKQRRRLIEVKSYQGSPHFYWSENEINKAMEKRNDYFLYLVDYGRIEDADYAPDIFENPYETIFGNETEWNKRAKSILFEKV